MSLSHVYNLEKISKKPGFLFKFRKILKGFSFCCRIFLHDKTQRCNKTFKIRHKNGASSHKIFHKSCFNFHFRAISQIFQIAAILRWIDQNI